MTRSASIGYIMRDKQASIEIIGVCPILVDECMTIREAIIMVISEEYLENYH